MYTPDGRKFSSYPELVEQREQGRQQADQARQQADQARQQADQAEERAERLAAQLRALGVDPQ